MSKKLESINVYELVVSISPSLSRFMVTNQLNVQLLVFLLRRMVWVEPNVPIAARVLFVVFNWRVTSFKDERKPIITTVDSLTYSFNN